MNIPFKKTKEPTDLEKLIKRLTDYIESMEASDGDYTNAVDQLVKLKKIHAEETRKPLSRDALLAAGVNIAGILIIVGFEHSHAMTSKAVNFVFKNKTI
jgi:hypothetical protein